MARENSRKINAGKKGKGITPRRPGISEETRARLRALPKEQRTKNKRAAPASNREQEKPTAGHHRTKPGVERRQRAQRTFAGELAKGTNSDPDFPLGAEAWGLINQGLPGGQALSLLWGEGLEAMFEGEDLGSEYESDGEGGEGKGGDGDGDEEEEMEDVEMEDVEEDDFGGAWSRDGDGKDGAGGGAGSSGALVANTAGLYGLVHSSLSV